jgi:transcriptional regulator with XRE-family HTH domain
MARLAPARTRLLIDADRRAARQAREIGDELRRLREDTGLDQAAVARAAGVSAAHLCRIEAGQTRASRPALARVAAVLGADVSERLFPTTGPRIRDRTQAAILEALLKLINPRWTPHLEVPIHRPVRGVIDLVLAHLSLLVATEVQSQIRRLEQQLRWSHEKAEGVTGTHLAVGRDRPTVSRLLVLRSTAASRELVRTHPQLFAAEFPAPAHAAFAALTSASETWPGPALLWARAEGATAAILATPPRGIGVGR